MTQVQASRIINEGQVQLIIMERRGDLTVPENATVISELNSKGKTTLEISNILADITEQ